MVTNARVATKVFTVPSFVVACKWKLSMSYLSPEPSQILGVVQGHMIVKYLARVYVESKITGGSVGNGAN